MSHGKNKKNFEVFCAEGFIAAITRQMRRAKREQKKLKNFLGRVYRNILRNCPQPDTQLAELLHNAKRLLLQQRHDKNKPYHNFNTSQSFRAKFASYTICALFSLFFSMKGEWSIIHKQKGMTLIIGLIAAAMFLAR